MALSINHVTLAGNLVRDAEYRTAASGTTVCNFGIAVSKRIKDQTGNWVDDADFFDCVLFGRLGESFRDNGSLIKGTPIALEGKLQLDRWQNKDGENRSKITVVANTVIPYAKRNSQQQQGGYNNQQYGDQHSYNNKQQQGGNWNQPQHGYNNTPQFNDPPPSSHDPYSMPGVVRDNITEDDIPF